VKKIISFSLWGHCKTYLCGALQNAKLAKTLFPGWVCSFYCDPNIPARIFKDLEALGAEIELKGISAEYSGLFWRYEPMNDPECERLIVRDADSRLTPRDAWCVGKWIESGQPFHIIRDEEGHNIEILGATWGCIPSFIPNFQELLDEFWDEFMEGQHSSGWYSKERGKYFGTDQAFLKYKIWPLVKDHHLAHDDRFHFTGREQKIEPKLDRKKEPYIGQVCEIEPEYHLYDLGV
jgi:hypothetical protein